jgi:hypothetical protein
MSAILDKIADDLAPARRLEEELNDLTVVDKDRTAHRDVLAHGGGGVPHRHPHAAGRGERQTFMAKLAERPPRAGKPSGAVTAAEGKT